MTSPRRVLFLAPVVLAGALATFYFSGRHPAKYTALPPDALLLVGAEKITAKDLARNFLPAFSHIPEIRDPPLELVYYNVIDSGDSYAIGYHPAWPTEVHPQSLKNMLYNAYRAFAFGSPRDIEFVELLVSKRTGQVVSLEYESDLEGKPFKEFQVHNNIYHLISGADVGSVRGKRLVNARDPQNFDCKCMRDGRVHLKINTWNHLMDLAPFDAALVAQPAAPPLVFLDDGTYRILKFGRRSKGRAESVGKPPMLP